jgi:hypothetical protein
MPRLIEIAMFLAPFAVVAIWRVLFPGPRPPLWLVYAAGLLLAGLAIALLWVWDMEAQDPGRAYIPAELRDGRVVPPRAGSHP